MEILKFSQNPDFWDREYADGIKYYPNGNKAS